MSLYEPRSGRARHQISQSLDLGLLSPQSWGAEMSVVYSALSLSRSALLFPHTCPFSPAGHVLFLQNREGMRSNPPLPATARFTAGHPLVPQAVGTNRVPLCILSPAPCVLEGWCTELLSTLGCKWLFYSGVENLQI